MTDITKIVDAHHHLWDLEAVHYPWLMARGVTRFFGDPTPIQRSYRVEDFRADHGDLPIHQSVHIQVGTSEADAVKETAWAQAQGDEHGLPSALVVFCDLSSDTAESDLDRHQAHDRVRGVRQIIGRAPAEDAKSGTPALLEHPVWRQNLARLGPRGLGFDLQLTPAQYEAALPVLAAASETPIVICHAGSPWDQSAEGFAFWRGAMARFAELDHVMCKVSGLGMFDAGWTAEGFQPWFDVLMERFGAERLMFGSNFPVDKLYGGYERVWLAFDRLSAGLSDAERAALFAGTAQRFYALS